MNDNVVHTSELYKRYGDRLGVDRVSMTLRRGEVYGLLEPDGAGKTTTLRMVVVLLPALALWLVHRRDVA